jgi:hypothetical protein
MAGALDGDTAMPFTFLGDEVLHHLHLLLAAAVLARSDVVALDLAAELLLGLLATVARLIEERIVHVLRHQGECHLALGAGEAGQAYDSDRSRR